MTTIWKFRLKLHSHQTIPVPSGAKPLCVQIQGGSVCIWLEVVPDNPICERIVRVCGTGIPMNTAHSQYVGTVQQNDFVWHVYIMEESDA